MDLSEFLLARIAEDEAEARDAAGDFPEWVSGVEETADGENVFFIVEPATSRPKAWKWELDYFLAIDDRTTARVDHIARWDPARVLAECEAKRRIVDEHAGGGGYRCDVCSEYDGPELMPQALPCPTLRFLALPYADHPDYDESWRP